MNEGTMNLDRAALAAWCNENLDSHSSSNAAVLLGLEEFGFKLTWGDDRFGQWVKVELNPGNIATIRLATWDDELRSIIDRGLPFVVIKPDAERDVEYFYVKSRRKVTTFDQDGNPKVNSPIYGVIKADGRPDGWLGGWILDTEEHRAMRTVEGPDVVSALARLVNGDDEGSRYQGRGSSFRGSLRSISGKG